MVQKWVKSGRLEFNLCTKGLTLLTPSIWPPLQVAEQQFQAVQQGLALAEEGDEEGGGAATTLEEQLRTAQGAESRAKTLKEQTELRLNHLRQEYESKLSQLQARQRQLGRQSQGMDLEQLEKQKIDQQAQITNLEAKMAALNFSPEAEERMASRLGWD